MTTTASHPLLEELSALDPNTPPTPREAREFCRRAKAANRSDVLPGWLIALAKVNTTVCKESSIKHQSDPGTPETVNPTAANTEKLLKIKSQDSGVALPILRTVFKRGLCEVSAAKLPTDPYEYAQARVNSFIRLCQGDCQAREDDVDLLSVAL